MLILEKLSLIVKIAPLDINALQLELPLQLSYVQPVTIVMQELSQLQPFVLLVPIAHWDQRCQ